MKVDITFGFPEWNQKVKRARSEIMLSVAAAMQTNRGMLFDAEGAYNGHEKWKSLALRDGQILSQRGQLRKSLAPETGKAGVDGIVRFSGDQVTIGTQKGYAAMMNAGTRGLPGGVLRPKNAQALRIPLPAGKSATPLAKEMRKTAASGKSMFEKLDELVQALETTQNPERRDRLRVEVQKLREKIASTKTKKTDRYLFVKYVKIDPRPFDQVNAQDAAEIEETLVNKVLEVLAR